MKLFIALFLLISNILFSQERVENIKNRKLIENIAYFQNEKTPFSGKFIGDGIIEEYREGIRDGYFKREVLFKDKKYICEGRFDNGLKNGEWTVKTLDNKLKAILKYYFDRPAGEWKYFNPNGTIIGIERFNDGELQGEVDIFNKNGIPKIVMNFEAGLLHKKFIAYHINGKISTLTNFNYGKLDGELKLFTSKGVMTVDGRYKLNERVGRWKFYYNSGELKSEVNYKDGKRDGESIIYGKGGEILQKLIFENGVEKNGEEEYKNYGDKILEGFKKFTDELEYKKYDEVLDEI